MENNDNTTEYNSACGDDDDEDHHLTETKPIRKRHKKRQRNHDGLSKKTPYAASTSSRPIDEFQIFGDYVASELRSLRTAKVRRSLKLEIQKAILRASEINDNDPSSPESCSSYSEPAAPNSLCVASYK